MLCLPPGTDCSSAKCKVFLIEYFDICEDIIALDLDEQFVISWLPQDVALLGFVTVPLVYWELVSCGSSSQWGSHS